MTHAAISCSLLPDVCVNHADDGAYSPPSGASFISHINNALPAVDIIKTGPAANMRAAGHRAMAETLACSQRGALRIKQLLKRVVSIDGTTFGEALECIYLQRAVTFSTRIDMVQGKKLQPVFAADEISTLEKHGDHYSLKKEADGSRTRPDGFYTFIVPFNAPDRICCAVARLRGRGNTLGELEKGHSSFTGRQAVKFAGTLHFRRGSLLYWNNASGHFMPPAELRYALPAYLRYVLPEMLFTHHMMMVCGDNPVQSADLAQQGVS